jgi:glucose-1-phosphate cytidylyltransferase
MKVVFLAGGYGSRISEYTTKIPKPMIKLCNKPIIEHLINYYQNYGFKDFLIAGGYKVNVLKKFFDNSRIFKNIKVKVVNTGLNTLTGKRIYKLKKFLKNEENFLLTYGDGISDIELTNLINFHKKKNSIFTLSAVRPAARFGELKISGNKIVNFQEKPQMQKGWINGGFFVVNKKFFKFLSNKNVMLEREPFTKVSASGKMFAYKHQGFWKCIDTKRDLDQFEILIKNKKFDLKCFKSEK